MTPIGRGAITSVIDGTATEGELAPYALADLQVGRPVHALDSFVVIGKTVAA